MTQSSLAGCSRRYSHDDARHADDAGRRGGCTMQVDHLHCRMAGSLQPMAEELTHTEALECRIGGFMGASFAVSLDGRDLLYEAFGPGYEPTVSERFEATAHSWQLFWAT